MARSICIQVPAPPPLPGITVPGVGTIMTVRDFSLDGYSICADARSFMLGIQPVFVGLGMPLCLLSCVTAVTGVFTSSFPYIDPGALTAIARECACLGGFTPFGFCGLLRSLVSGSSALVACITGLLTDIVRLESQAAALSSNPATALAGQCLGNNASVLRQTIAEAFEAVVSLFEATGFLFSFVGVAMTPIGSLDGGSSSAMLQSLLAVQNVLIDVNVAISNVCPP